MANPVLVNNIDHKNVKIDTRRSAELGDNVWFTLTFPDEFRAVQTHYPIFFQKDPNTGEFFPVALFGFAQNENLFLDENGWDAGYVPLFVQRQPFTIGTQMQTIDGQSQENRVLTMDMDHPRVNEEQGEPLFLEFGGNSDYLERIAGMMETLHLGNEQNKDFIACLTELELLEAVNVDVQLNDGSKHQMVGFYTINEEKLDQLPDDKLARLVKSKYLFFIHMVLASQTNISHLLKRKNRQLGL